MPVARLLVERYKKRHLAAQARSANGLRGIFKFSEILCSTTYIVNTMMLTTLSKPQNTKISSISVQTIAVNCCSWPSSYFYIAQELSNRPHIITTPNITLFPKWPFPKLATTKHETFNPLLQTPTSLNLRYFEVEKTKYDQIRSLLHMASA